MRIFRRLFIIIVLGSAFVIQGCSSPSTQIVTDDAGAISGKGKDGDVKKADVILYSLRNDGSLRKVGSGKVKDGKFSAKVKSAVSGPILAVIGDPGDGSGRFYNDAAGAQSSFNGDTLAAVLENFTSGERLTNVNITPLTTIAADLAVKNAPSKGAKAAATAANLRVAQAFGLNKNLLASDPILPTAGGNNTDTYGILLLSISQAAKDLGVNPLALTRMIARDALDGILNGKDSSSGSTVALSIGSVPLPDTLLTPTNINVTLNNFVTNNSSVVINNTTINQITNGVQISPSGVLPLSPPIILDVQNSLGSSVTSVTAGDVITIIGSNFSQSGVLSVSFQGTQTTLLTVISDSEISITVPSRASSGNMVVNLGSVSSNAFFINVLQSQSSSASFTSSNLKADPAFGPLTGGNIVYLIAQGLDTSATVFFGGSKAEIIDAAKGVLAVKPPASASAGTVKIEVRQSSTQTVSNTSTSTSTAISGIIGGSIKGIKGAGISNQGNTLTAPDAYTYQSFSKIQTQSEINSGRLALMNADFPKALAYFNTALGADTNNAEALFERAQTRVLFALTQNPDTDPSTVDSLNSIADYFGISVNVFSGILASPLGFQTPKNITPKDIQDYVEDNALTHVEESIMDLGFVDNHSFSVALADSEIKLFRNSVNFLSSSIKDTYAVSLFEAKDAFILGPAPVTFDYTDVLLLKSLLRLHALDLFHVVMFDMNANWNDIKGLLGKDFSEFSIKKSGGKYRLKDLNPGGGGGFFDSSTADPNLETFFSQQSTTFLDFRRGQKGNDARSMALGTSDDIQAFAATLLAEASPTTNEFTDVTRFSAGTKARQALDNLKASAQVLKSVLETNERLVNLRDTFQNKKIADTDLVYEAIPAGSLSFTNNNQAIDDIDPSQLLQMSMKDLIPNFIFDRQQPARFDIAEKGNKTALSLINIQKVFFNDDPSRVLSKIYNNFEIGSILASAANSAGTNGIGSDSQSIVFYDTAGFLRIFLQLKHPIRTVDTWSVTQTSGNNRYSFVSASDSRTFDHRDGNGEVIFFLSFQFFDTQSRSFRFATTYDPLGDGFRDGDMADSFNFTFSAPKVFAGETVIGQPDVFSKTSNNGGISDTSLSNPQKIALDASGNLYVADQSNNRVLIFNNPITEDNVADTVLGQPDFISSTSNNGGLSANSLSGPGGVFVDQRNRLYVSDNYNSRILIFDNPTSGDSAADTVLGQPNFSTNGSNQGGLSANSLSLPSGLYVDAQFRLYAADASNHRVLIFDSPSMADTTADTVLGQPNFTSNTWNNGGLSANSLYSPRSVFLNNDHLYIADASNHRVLIFNSPSMADTTADTVLGQPDFTSNTWNNGGLSLNSLVNPWDVSIDASSRLYVVDAGNNRVLIFDNPTSGDTTADTVLEQNNQFSTPYPWMFPFDFGSGSFSSPAGIAIGSGGQRFISDSGRHRVLIGFTN